MTLTTSFRGASVSERTRVPRFARSRNDSIQNARLTIGPPRVRQARRQARFSASSRYRQASTPISGLSTWMQASCRQLVAPVHFLQHKSDSQTAAARFEAGRG